MAKRSRICCRSLAALLSVRALSDSERMNDAPRREPQFGGDTAMLGKGEQDVAAMQADEFDGDGQTRINRPQTSHRLRHVAFVKKDRRPLGASADPIRRQGRLRDA